MAKKRKSTKAAVSKRYDLDVGKQRSRAKLRKFIKKRLFNRKKAHVLCLPGSYGTEIESIYRKLGIPDHNIFGVERDPAAAKRIQERYPEINVYCGEMNHFIYEYDGPPFDIVSLDYCGYYSPRRLAAVSLLAANHRLSRKAVIAVNFMAGREQARHQDQIRLQHALATMCRSAKQRPRLYSPDTIDELAGILDSARNEDLSTARNDAMTYSLSSILGFTIPSAEIARAYGIEKVRGHGLGLSIDSEILGTTDEGIELSNTKELDTKDPLLIGQMVKHEAIQQINKEIESSGVAAYAKATADPVEVSPEFFDYHLGRTLVMCWYDKHSNPNLPVDMERYSYISESGRRMLCDFILTEQIDLSNVPDAIAVYQDPDDPEHHNFLLTPSPDEYADGDSYVRTLKKIVLSYTKRVGMKVKTDADTFPERIDLGGGKAVPFDEDKIKQRIVALIEKGRSNEEIAAKYSIYTPNQIRAIRAHVTMGTYDEAQGGQST